MFQIHSIGCLCCCRLGCLWVSCWLCHSVCCRLSSWSSIVFGRVSCLHFLYSPGKSFLWRASQTIAQWFDAQISVADEFIALLNGIFICLLFFRFSQQFARPVHRIDSQVVSFRNHFEAVIFSVIFPLYSD